MRFNCKDIRHNSLINSSRDLEQSSAFVGRPSTFDFNNADYEKAASALN